MCFPHARQDAQSNLGLWGSVPSSPHGNHENLPRTQNRLVAITIGPS